MIRSLLTFSPAAEDVPALLELYRRLEILSTSLRHTRQIRSDIAVAADGSGTVLVTADWPDAAAYTEWLEHPVRGRFAPQLQELLGRQVGEGALYQVDHGASRE